MRAGQRLPVFTAMSDTLTPDGEPRQEIP